MEPESQDAQRASAVSDRRPPVHAHESRPNLSSEPCIVNGRYRTFATWQSTADVMTYAAEDLTVSGRRVDLKVLCGEFAANAEFVAAVHEQARLLSKSESAHESIARVYGCDVTEDGKLVVIVERVEGRTLREVLDTGALDSYSAVLIASQVGEALDDLHSNGIVHGELRPECVVVVRTDDGNETVKLVGVELTAAHRTALGLRTRDVSPYVAPEQREHGETTEASDIYALGRLLQDLLIGTKRDIVAPAWGETRPVPPPMERIIAKALETRPQARYRTVSAMLSDMWRAQRQIDEASPAQVGLSSERSERSTVADGPRARLALVCVLVAIVLVAAVSIALAGRITALYRAAAAGPTPPASPAGRAAAVSAPTPMRAPTGRSEVPSVLAAGTASFLAPSPSTTAPRPTPGPSEPLPKERGPASSTLRRQVTTAPVVVRDSRPAPAAGRAAARPTAAAIPSTDSARPIERPQRAELAQDGADDGTAAIDWLFNRRSSE